MLEQNWPRPFSRGRFAQDSAVRTQVVDFRCQIEIGPVRVQPGDLVFGDLDGVVIVPKRVEAEVIERAAAKGARRETRPPRGGEPKQYGGLQKIRDSLK